VSVSTSKPPREAAVMGQASGEGAEMLLDRESSLYTDVLGAWEPDGRSKEQQHFAKLIEAATEEITGRYPDYFSNYGVGVGSIAELARSCQALPAFERFCVAELELALARGLQVLDGLHIRSSLHSETDGISKVLLQSILDAYAAVRGLIALNPPPLQTDASEELPNGRYSVEETPSGVRYALSRAEGRPLLIVSTTGAPLRIWSTLLNDPEFRRPCLSIQSRAGSFLEGGTPNRSTLLQDVVDIQEVLRTNNLDQVDIVAWCNGSRVAIALAQEEPGRVASLLLVSPTFRGSLESDKYPSPFEDQLVAAYQIVNNDEATGRNLINCFTDPDMTNPGQLPQRAEKRVNAVLRLPPHARAKDLLIPLSSIEYFRNYVDRVLSDEGFDVRAGLKSLCCPIMLVSGPYDTAVNTKLARDLLCVHGRDVLQATLSGAGHHIHLLQYSYLKHLLDHLAARSVPVTTARMQVERLAPVQ
jgi:pimeloyl-ACP methyl ester carboxylesterase